MVVINMQRCVSLCIQVKGNQFKQFLYPKYDQNYPVTSLPGFLFMDKLLYDLQLLIWGLFQMSHLILHNLMLINILLCNMTRD